MGGFGEGVFAGELGMLFDEGGEGEATLAIPFPTEAPSARGSGDGRFEPEGDGDGVGKDEDIGWVAEGMDEGAAEIEGTRGK